MHLKYIHIFILLIFAWASPTAIAKKESLENQDWLTSLEKRALLKFITQCALRKDQVLTVETDGLVFEYYGNLGTAPNWDGYPNSLTPSEQRWVSACVLARVNYFSTPVPINMRTKATSGFKIPVTEKELDQFPYHEGGFFGNIFIDNKKYVCQGDAPKKVLVGKNRICSMASIGQETSKISSCGYTIVGDCDDPSVFFRDGINYKETIHVWLKLH